jgi:2-amino-4-hydroxy-6-hydroxymethyldihydropteridine diphosphokinase
MSIFYLGLGSNQEDPKLNLSKALVALESCGQLLSVSSVYETEPKYEVSQAKFLNMACAIDTELAAIELFEAVKTIEQELGRITTYKNGPRVIDIDILFSEDESYNDESLQIPHSRLAERAFVLVPLNEIAANIEIPSLGKISDLLASLDSHLLSEVRLLSKETYRAK